MGVAPSYTPAHPMIGLIINPVSSKDIRRLVALGRVVPVEEKANLVARFLAGVAGGPPTEVVALDDSAGVARRALRMAGRHAPTMSFLDVEAQGNENDTINAASTLRDLGADLVAVVGGDGTLRATVEGWPEVPLLLLPAGTNNAFASPVEPTVAGLAAAHVSEPEVRAAALERRNRLDVDAADGSTTAVVDVVGVSERWLGSGAIWRPAELVEAVVSHADPSSIGMAAVAAVFGPLGRRAVRYMGFGEGERVKAAFGPGLIVEVSVAAVRDVGIGEEVRLDSRTGVVALDGERRVLGGAAARVVARPGPAAFDPGAALLETFGSVHRST